MCEPRTGAGVGFGWISSDTMTMDMPPVMSPKTLAEILEINPKSLERWRDAKTGPAWLKLPGSSLIRYTRDDVLAWLESARFTE